MEIKLLDQKLHSTVSEAHNWAVDSKISYELAVGWLRDIKTLQHEINETFDPIIRKAHEAHKEALAQKKRHEEPLVQAEKVMKSKLLAWDNEQKRLIALETERIQAENRKKLDEAIKLKEEQALAEAEQIQDKEIQDMVLETAICTPPVVELEDVPQQEKTQGISYRTFYKFEIIDEKSIKLEFMKPDEVKIGGVVRSMKEEAEKIVGGIRVIADRQPDVRRF